MMDERTAVTKFLNKCNAYARDSIDRKRARNDVEEIPAWEAYIAFNDHALEEIANGTLDAWFEDQHDHTDAPVLQRLEVGGMEHVERSIWLNNVLSPRPVVIAGTHNEDGVANFAPYSSVMQVSTAPPYLTVSFSIHKDGRVRDTHANLRATKRVMLNVLAPTPNAANTVDQTATPLPLGESETTLPEVSVSASSPLILSDAVAAIEASWVEEHPLPDAVATLVVLRVEAVWFTGTTAPPSGIATLCQHGRDEITPSPVGWKRTVSKHYGED